MKNDKLQDSIGMIGEDLIERARQEKKSPKINRWVLAMACISVAMLATVIIFKNITISQPEQPQKAGVVQILIIQKVDHALGDVGRVEGLQISLQGDILLGL